MASDRVSPSPSEDFACPLPCSRHTDKTHRLDALSGSPHFLTLTELAAPRRGPLGRELRVALRTACATSRPNDPRKAEFRQQPDPPKPTL